MCALLCYHLGLQKTCNTFKTPLISLLDQIFGTFLLSKSTVEYSAIFVAMVARRWLLRSLMIPGKSGLDDNYNNYACVLCCVAILVTSENQWASLNFFFSSDFWHIFGFRIHSWIQRRLCCNRTRKWLLLSFKIPGKSGLDDDLLLCALLCCHLGCFRKPVTSSKLANFFSWPDFLHIFGIRILSWIQRYLCWNDFRL